MEPSEHSKEPGPRSKNNIPVVVKEALNYLLQLELSSLDMKIPAPILDAKEDQITALQQATLTEQIKDIRGEALMWGTNINLKENGENIIGLRTDHHEVFSSSVHKRSDRLFWFARHGFEKQPDIFLSIFKGKALDIGFELKVAFFEVPEGFRDREISYESGRRPLNTMEPHEYTVASFALNEAYKLINPSEHK